MRARHLGGLCGSIGALLLLVGAAPPSSPAQAKAQLEAAESALAAAAGRLQQQPPPEADLTAAEAALATLKRALDEGSRFEPKDLEYAKAALAARKDHRAKSEYVQQRRLEASVELGLQSIDRALSALKTAVDRTEHDPTPDAFIRARAAALEVKKALESGRTLAAQNAKYAAQVKTAEAELAKQARTIDERELRIKVAQQSAALEQAKNALDHALDQLQGKDIEDARYQQAESAAASLRDLLASGKPLEASDKTYRAQAAKLGAFVRDAKKRIDAEWSAAGLARLKAEIEPARAELAQAARAMKGKQPTEDQRALARNAAIIVEKLLERFRPLASKSPAFAKYVSEVEAALVAVQVELQRRGVEEARAAVEKSLATLRGPNPSDVHFEEANASMAAFEKTIDSAVKKDAEFSRWLQDQKGWLERSRRDVGERRTAVEVHRQKEEVRAARDAVASAMRRIQGRRPKDEEFDEAKNALAVLDQTIAKSKAVAHKDAAFGKYLAEAKDALKRARSDAEKRRLDVTIDLQRERVSDALAAVNHSLARLPGLDEVKAGETAVNALDEALTAGKELMSKDRAYGRYARDAAAAGERARTRLATRRDEIAIDAQRSAVERELTGLSNAVAALDTVASPAAFEGASKSLAATKSALDAGAELEKRLPQYRKWAEQARKSVDAHQKRIDKRALEVAVGEGTTEVDQRVAEAKAALDRAKQPSATAAEITKATAAAQAARTALDSRASLEKRDKTYHAHATKQRGELDRLEGEIEMAEHLIAFRQGPLTEMTAGVEAAKAAATAGDLETKKSQYERAVERFEACRRDSATMLGDHPRIASSVVRVEEESAQAKELITMCADRAQSAKAELDAVNAVFAVENGPVKSLQDGQARAAEATKATGDDQRRLREEALAKLETCLSAGRILQYEHPELKERKFDVGGKKLTLPAVIDACQQRVKQLRALVDSKKS